MKATNIKWDTDGDMELLQNLPTEMEIPEEFETEDEGDMDFDGIANWLSDQTGFCLYGFRIG